MTYRVINFLLDNRINLDVNRARKESKVTCWCYMSDDNEFKFDLEDVAMMEDLVYALDDFLADYDVDKMVYDAFVESGGTASLSKLVDNARKLYTKLSAVKALAEKEM